MITYRKVREDDLELNSKIEDLNIKVFPSTETTSDLHFLENYYKGASVDFIAIEDDAKFVGYTYMINFFQGSFIYYLAIEPEYQSKGYGTALLCSCLSFSMRYGLTDASCFIGFQILS